MAALAGANLIYGLGMLELGMTMDYAQLVIDNEIANMIKRAVGGIDVTDENLAVDVIKQVGASGEFLSHKHTRANFRQSQSQTNLFDRRMREAWLHDGGRDLTDRAYEKAKGILENHVPDPLPQGAAETMQEIIKEAEAKYKK